MRTYEKGFIYSLLFVWGTAESDFLILAITLSSLFLTLQIIHESPRWQLFPAYFAFVLFANYQIYSVFFESQIGWLLPTVLMLAALVALLLAIAFPVPSFPPPVGKLPIGTQFFHFDSKQVPHDWKEPHPKLFSSDQKCILECKVWYPRTDDPKAKSSVLFLYDSVLGPVMERLVKQAPAWVASHLSLVRVNSVLDAPLRASDKKYPILLFSHGLTGIPENYTRFAEDMASLGYFVCSVWHTDGSAACTLDEQGHVQQQFPYIVLPSEQPEEEKLKFRTQQLEQRLRDVQTAFLGLQQLPAFQNNLDFERVGIFGHSFGGITALMAAKRIPAIRAAVCLDGWIEPATDEMLDAPTGANLLCLNAEHFQWRANLERMARLLRSTSGAAYMLTLLQTGHQNFSDMPVMLPTVSLLLSKLMPKMIGSLDTSLCFTYVNHILPTFFEHHLRDSTSPLSTSQLLPLASESHFKIHDIKAKE